MRKELRIGSEPELLFTSPMNWSTTNLALWTSSVVSMSHLLFVFTRLAEFRRIVRNELSDANTWLYSMDVQTREAVVKLANTEKNGAPLGITDALAEFMGHYKKFAELHGSTGVSFLLALNATDCEAADILRSNCPESLSQLAKRVGQHESEIGRTVFGNTENDTRHLVSGLLKVINGVPLSRDEIRTVSSISGQVQIVLGYFKSTLIRFKRGLVGNLILGRVTQEIHALPTSMELPFGYTISMNSTFLESYYTTEVYGDELVDSLGPLEDSHFTSDVVVGYEKHKKLVNSYFRSLAQQDIVSYVDSIGLLLCTVGVPFSQLFNEKDATDLTVIDALQGIAERTGTKDIPTYLKERVTENGELTKFQVRLLTMLLSQTHDGGEVLEEFASFTEMSIDSVSDMLEGVLRGRGFWYNFTKEKRDKFTEKINEFYKLNATMVSAEDMEEFEEANAIDTRGSGINEVETLQNIIMGKDRGENMAELKRSMGDTQEHEEVVDGIQMPYGENFTTAFMQKCKDMYVKHEKLIEESILDVFGRNRKNCLLLVGEEGSGVTTHINHLISKQYLNGNLKLNGKDLAICTIPTVSSQPGLPQNYVAKTISKILSDYCVKIADYSSSGKTDLFPVAVYENLGALVNYGPAGTDCHIESVLGAFNSNGVKAIFTCSQSTLSKLAKEEQKLISKHMEVVKLEKYNEEEVLKSLSYSIAELEGYYFYSAPEGLKEMIVQYAKEYYKGANLLECSNNLALRAFSKASVHDYHLCHKDNTSKYRVRFDIEALNLVVRLDNGIKAEDMDKNPYEAVKELEKGLKAEVFGQEEAITQFLRQWKIAKSGLRESNKPECVLFFTGQTGVGKTELAKQIAELTSKKLIRLDMSEYSQGFTTSSLIGSASGYVGYTEGGILTNAVKENPNCVLLLDEVEKAHRDVHDLLLQIMDNAELTSNNGTKVNFQKAVIIMTSNCGATDVIEKKALGFNSTLGDTKDLEDVYSKALKDKFRPEFLARINAIIQFKPLDTDISKKIINHKLDSLTKTVADKYANIADVKVDRTLTQHYLEQLSTNKAGARGIFNQMSNDVLEPLCDALLMHGVKKEMSASRNYPVYRLKLTYKGQGSVTVSKTLVK